MKIVLVLLVVILSYLQLRLWVGDGSYAEIAKLNHAIDKQQRLNTRDQERNRVLAVEINHLKNGLSSVEELAREDMGMIKPGETFYLVVDNKD